MQVFKCFFKLIRSNLALLVLYMVIFISLATTLSKIGTGQTENAFVQTRVNIAVLDADGSPASEALKSFLAANHSLVPLKNSPEAVQDAIYNRSVYYVLYIPAGYGAALARGDAPLLETVQVPGSTDSYYVDNLVGRYQATLLAYLGAGLDVARADEYTRQDLSAGAATTLLAGNAGQATSGVFNFYKYLCYAYLMTMIFGLAAPLMVLSRKELLVRFNASALPLKKKNTQLLLATLCFALACTAVVTLVGLVTYGAQMFTPGALLAGLVSLAFLAFCVALGFLVGHVSRSGSMLSAIGNVLGLGMCFLGGVYVPLEVMGSSMVKFARFFPTYWYVTGIEAASRSTAFNLEALRAISPNLLLILLFALAVLCVGLVVTRQKQRVR